MHKIRRADPADIPRLSEIRLAVKENRLSDPAGVTTDDYRWFVAAGRVWVCEVGGRIAGFSASDPRDGSIWALFVDQDHEGCGIGKRLLDRACADLAADGHKITWLTTGPDTRAARLYRHLGWHPDGPPVDGDIRMVRALTTPPPFPT